MDKPADVAGCLSAPPITCPPFERPAWYVVYSKPHREGFAALQLRRRGIDVFWPQLVFPDYARGARCVSLFPNYLFVNIRLRGRAPAARRRCRRPHSRAPELEGRPARRGGGRTARWPPRHRRETP